MSAQTALLQPFPEIDGSARPTKQSRRSWLQEYLQKPAVSEILSISAANEIGVPPTMGSIDTIAEIDALTSGSEDEIPPTEFAYRRARSIVESAYGRITTRFNVPEILPKPSATTDDVGGIRLAWRVAGKQIRANFGATPELRSYIYYESGLEHSVEHLDARHLAGRLAWLAER